ncbi:hypothetical protein BZM27_51075 [Paraburkholderia steynii]|uniref:Uncharacterized protein n=1 Tax=Paraburkholderia steynii TaxID=1245441 RepID=A0A4R0X6M9_9BURK|nr:hypothetical protein BZM27_51075 [Paraburkholderia steynii]
MSSLDRTTFAALRWLLVFSRDRWLERDAVMKEMHGRFPMYCAATMPAISRCICSTQQNCRCQRRCLQ